MGKSEYGTKSNAELEGLTDFYYLKSFQSQNAVILFNKLTANAVRIVEYCICSQASKLNPHISGHSKHMLALMQ